MLDDISEGKITAVYSMTINVLKEPEVRFVFNNLKDYKII
jgi:hypothetical protein